ncbi:MAG TPA: biotin--[acetyl-CoA-carboxylase] ligase [Pseudomonadales bacterium]|nr:biotin--[acetyl-CoA-carboxylase] ligase [Pseudomonadales bacterium]
MRDLLMLLADGRFYSGSDLGLELGVSRAAVWKRIQRVTEDFGISIQSVPGKGYRLSQPLQLLREDTIRNVFPSLPIYMYESIGSTNEQAKQLLLERSAPLVVMAEHQTSGKGRRGKEWVSPFAQNMYLTYVWPVSGGLSQIDGLSLVVGLAVSSAIKRVTEILAPLKWPNDVLINDKKVAGILLELVGDPADLCHVVIGIGVNLNMTGTFDGIDQEWTSLQEESSTVIDRTIFAQVLIEELDSYLQKQSEYGFEGLKAQWIALHAWHGRKGVLRMGNSVVEGEIVGVGDKGELCLLIDGEEQKFIGGELSLRLKHAAGD